MIRRAGCLLLVAAFTLSACGGGSNPAPAPGPTNAPPGFTSAAATTVTSGATGIVYSATATDPNNDALTFSITGGVDAALFQITSAGALSFRTPPDAGAPADSDRNNVYLVQLTVSDGQASATLSLSVTVVAGQAGFRVRRVATGFSQPLFLSPVPGSDRVFIVERTGRIRIVDPASGAVIGTFLDVAAQISTDGERGLLGFTTAPNFATSRNFYVYLTNPQGTIEVRRYRTLASDPEVADPASADVILSVPHPGFSNHNGGWIGFGPDNLLYIGTGDGGGAGDPNNNAQNTSSLLGKMLRIDPSGDAFPADNSRDYLIPAANPFAGGGGAPEVLALGLRNPFRNSFDDNRLYIGDVGQGAVEEVDLLLTSDGAVNFGWPILEGTSAFRGGNAAGLTLPVAEYRHGSGALEGNSITGGLVYRGPVSSLQGSYIFGDFVNPRIWSLPAASLNRGTTVSSSSFVDRLAALAPNAGAFTNIVAFGTDRSGNLYIVDFDGEIFVLERFP